MQNTARPSATDPSLTLPEVRHRTLSDIAAFLEEEVDDLTDREAPADAVVYVETFRDAIVAFRDGDVAELNAALRAVAALASSSNVWQAVRVFPHHRN